jgi:low affinity Fe/Cu permease
MNQDANRRANPDLDEKAEGGLGFFDRFAEGASTVASRAPFFAFCVLLIVIWSPSIFFLKFDVSQLLINTATTIITFLLVALIQNSQKRFENSTNFKLNAIADAQADHMEVLAESLGEGNPDRCARLRAHAEDLRKAMGIEEKISA